VFVKSLRIGFVGLILCAATAWAGPSSIQGIVKDPKGHPIKGADIRIETTNGGKLLTTVKTDANGRYISNGVPVGIYRVSLVMNGAVKASINNTTTKADRPTQLNFDLKPVPAAQANTATKGGKHMVWVPATTGSHIGGNWVEVDDNAAIGALNVKRGNAEALHREQMQNSLAPQSVPGGGSSTGP